MGHLIHLEEQNSVTNTELNKTKADRLGALEEAEDANNEDLIKDLRGRGSSLIRELAESNRRKTERAAVDYVLLIFIGLSMLMMGLMVGINIGIERATASIITALILIGGL